MFTLLQFTQQIPFNKSVTENSGFTAKIFTKYVKRLYVKTTCTFTIT